MFFVASPLHYLAARAVACQHETTSRCLLVAYRPGVLAFVDASKWDQVVYAPWPRFDPLPGWFGRHRRLQANIDAVATAVGQCTDLVIHSPVFDTEAVNYFLRALPRRCGARRMRARIIPDGLLNVSRYPLTRTRELAQQLRRLRRLASPDLDYWCFKGDRIGSDAEFVDRIYTLQGFPNPYPAHKAVELGPLVDTTEAQPCDAALVIGQPLVSGGALSQADHDAIRAEMARWLHERDIGEVFYKAHPRDPNHEFRVDGSRELLLDVPLEVHLAQCRYRAVLGVNSTAMLAVRQACGFDVPVVSFGNDRVAFKSEDTRRQITDLFDRMKIERR